MGTSLCGDPTVGLAQGLAQGIVLGLGLGLGLGRDGRYQLFQIDTIPIRYQGFSVVSIPNFDTDTIKYEPSSKVLL